MHTSQDMVHKDQASQGKYQAQHFPGSQNKWMQKRQAEHLVMSQTENKILRMVLSLIDVDRPAK